MWTHDWAVRWADYMVRHGAQESQRDVYVYGLECTLNELFSDILLLFFASLFGRIPEMLCWILLFNLFRTYVGGYHARTPLGCLAGSTLAGVACIMVYPILTGHTFTVLVLTGICMELSGRSRRLLIQTTRYRRNGNL